MTPVASQKVLVVGGGASGALVAVQLLGKGDFAVTVAEPSLRLGLGVAYSTTDENHLLNVPAGKMSAFPDRPDHFLQYFLSAGRPVEPTGSVPRMWFGE